MDEERALAELRPEKRPQWGTCASGPIFRGLCATSPKRPRSLRGVRVPLAPSCGACVPRAPFRRSRPAQITPVHYGERAGVGRLGQACRSRSLSSVSMSM
jgi:hypothetical protein